MQRLLHETMRSSRVRDSMRGDGDLIYMLREISKERRQREILRWRDPMRDEERHLMRDAARDLKGEK
ncbi:hypothetical protein TNCT_253161 [Trichonephila clavata]|uniref:Uncharacterized protein n=1 Tax=Trichonephila clavata TaxID=2740835 RepID=A0A8X6LUI8_TRICU|nr:hypothetical protein TNCT_253161 [Trichonephila clavata]